MEEYIVDDKKLQQGIINAKKWIAASRFREEKEMIELVEKYNKEVCLVTANFRCQKCQSENELQFHHLIMRRAKEFMDFWRYASQRYYWANMIILCNTCHNQYHEIFHASERKLLSISPEYIEKIKEKYRLKQPGVKV